MTTRLVLETTCEHGVMAHHRLLIKTIADTDTGEHCPGGSRIVLDDEQVVVIESKPGQADLGIPVSALLAALVEETTK